VKILRIIFYGVAGLVLVAIIAAAGVALVVDGAFVKARLERAMKEKNRTLSIEGTPRLTLFPVAGLALGKTTLSEPGSDRTFLALDSAEVAVRVMPLLYREARLEGRANVSLDVTTSGATVPAMKKALGGAARVELKQGAVKGVNLAESFRDVKSVLGSRSAKAGDPAKKTDFSDLTASFAIRNGVARNDDLQGKSPFLRLAGAGDLDIGNNAIHYLAKASLVATGKGQGGQDLSHLAGVTVPVRLTGALDKPDWNVDYGELAARSGVGKMVEKAGAAGSGAGERIKGLFRR
jgi:AsmA protein